MRIRHMITAAVLAIATDASAQSNGWMQTADPQVVQALNELVMVYGNACQYGNQQACWMAQNVQSQGGMMLNAGHQCQMTGDPQACQLYHYTYAQLEQIYYATQQAVMQGQYTMPQQGYASGTTHQQRMQEIRNWGQQRLQWGQQQQQMMDQNHQQFLEYLRN